MKLACKTTVPALGFMAALMLGLCIAANSAARDQAPPLVDSLWLAQRLDGSSLVVLDIRSAIGGSGFRDYLAGHVPGAVFSDFMTDAWHDRDSAVPSTLPPVKQLELLLGRLGVQHDSMVVLVHSGSGAADFSTAARIYWILRLLGHERVAILDGGMRAWTASGLPLERGWVEPRLTAYRALTFGREWLATTAEVESAMGRQAVLIDARDREQFEGGGKPPLVPRAGTLPGAINLEHHRLVDPQTGRVVDGDALAALLDEVGVADPDMEVITFCNFGYLSAAIWFLLHELGGYTRVSLYDGSMAEWTGVPERPVVASFMPGPAGNPGKR